MARDKVFFALENITHIGQLIGFKSHLFYLLAKSHPLWDFQLPHFKMRSTAPIAARLCWVNEMSLWPFQQADWDMEWGSAQVSPPLPFVLWERFLRSPLLGPSPLCPLGKLSSSLCNFASVIHCILNISLLSSPAGRLLAGSPDSFPRGVLPSAFWSPQMVVSLTSYLSALPCTLCMHVRFNHLGLVPPVPLLLLRPSHVYPTLMVVRIIE